MVYFMVGLLCLLLCLFVYAKCIVMRFLFNTNDKTHKLQMKLVTKFIQKFKQTRFKSILKTLKHNRTMLKLNKFLSFLLFIGNTFGISRC